MDWDIVIPGDAHKLARRLAGRLGGHYVSMHEKASRVVVVLDSDPTANKKHKKEIHLDISPQNDKTIVDDLHQRDFTLNAIAAPLATVVKYLESELSVQGPAGALTLIDPCHGQADLQARRLRAVNGEVFRHDPLRMLRAIRLMMRYGLQMDGWTEALMIRDAALLPQVAAERVHDELYAILEPDGASERLRFLDTHGLFTVIFPEFIAARGMRQPAPHYWDVLQHSIESVGALELVGADLSRPSPIYRPVMPGDAHSRIAYAPSIIAPQGGEGIPHTPINGATGTIAAANNTIPNGSVSGDVTEIRTLLYEAQQQGIFSFAALTAPRMKLAALLHDIGKPLAYSRDEEGEIHFYNHPQAGVPVVEQVMRRLCASAQDRRLAQLVAAHHMRPGQLAQGGPVTPRAIRRYFVDLGPTGIYVALLSLADHLATLGPQPATGSWERHLGVVRLLLTRYIRQRDSILPPQLISPEELMRRLKLPPGPVIGQLLDLISEAQAEGAIHSREEAVWFAGEKLNQLRPYPETSGSS